MGGEAIQGRAGKAGGIITIIFIAKYCHEVCHRCSLCREVGQCEFSVTR